MRLSLQFPVFQMGRAREMVSVSCLLGEVGDCGGVAALPEPSKEPSRWLGEGLRDKGLPVPALSWDPTAPPRGHKDGKTPCVRTGHLKPSGLSSSASPLCSPSRLLSASVPIY